MMPNASYYRNGNIYCLKCPAGNFVKKDCVIPYTQGICHMCDPGVTYSEYPNGLNRCLTCTQCRAVVLRDRFYNVAVMQRLILYVLP
ncbi:tumor necrosis factor receptor superfamily member 23-like [Leptodactylus fuscus]|uniref:tumor necrosis factor receptor superfamily member 23-like n=1 Tax=Leptodactylus fuscus TaxID=238119 RepID=UPI003F4E4C91